MLTFRYSVFFVEDVTRTTAFYQAAFGFAVRYTTAGYLRDPDGILIELTTPSPRDMRSTLIR